MPTLVRMITGRHQFVYRRPGENGTLKSFVAIHQSQVVVRR